MLTYTFYSEDQNPKCSVQETTNVMQNTLWLCRAGDHTMRTEHIKSKHATPA